MPIPSRTTPPTSAPSATSSPTNSSSTPSPESPQDQASSASDALTDQPSSAQSALLKLSCARLLMRLPIDDTLRCFLERMGLHMPSNFDWTDTRTNAQQLLLRLDQSLSLSTSEHLMAELQLGLQLATPTGKHALYQALATTGRRYSTAEQDVMLLGLVGCEDDLHRSFWLFVHHRDFFEQTLGMMHAGTPLLPPQRHALGPGQFMDREPARMAALCEEVQTFYTQAGANATYTASVQGAPGQAQLLTITEGRSTPPTAHTDNEYRDSSSKHKRSVLMVEYCARSGIARTLMPGDAMQHRLLAQAFAKHLLRADRQGEARTLQGTDLERAPHHQPWLNASASVSTSASMSSSASPSAQAGATPLDPTRRGPFSENFRWVYLADWPHGLIRCTEAQSKVFAALWSFGGQFRSAAQVMQAAGLGSTNPGEVFKVKSAHQGLPEYEGARFAFRALVRVQKRLGLYAMPCAASQGSDPTSHATHPGV